MTIYAYKCRECGQRFEASLRADRLDVICPCGNDVATRDYSSISIGIAPFETHFNASVGSVVTSPRDHAEKLRRLGEQYTETTGIPTRYVPVDPRDTAALGITEEGLEATNRRRVDIEKLPPIRVP